MLKQDQEVFNILLNSVIEGVVIVDEHQTIVEVNSATETLFKYQSKELLKQPLDILIPKQYHTKHNEHFKNFSKKKRHRKMADSTDIFGAKKGGESFPVEVSLSPFTIYGSKYIMAIISDITEKKNYTEKLEKTVEIRTEELKTALATEKELNELKTKFLSMVSHEFKTPLSGILTSTMLLSKYKLSEQQSKREKHIKTITDKVQYLNTILNDFLSVEKLEKGKIKYKFTTFKLSKVLNEVIYNANMLLKEGQHINYPENIDDISLYQDEKIVELALSNIIYNAIKYSLENATIDIKIEQDDSTTILKIIDNGIGIPKKDQKNIFNRYFRAENALLMHGTGIGLNIAKDHIENLNGTITFKSIENKGSTFIIEIPNKAQQ